MSQENMFKMAEWPFSPAVSRAIQKVDRQAFIPEPHKAEADGDYPLPIGFGQTISQPSLVAFMTEELGLLPDSRVLDVGTGSGYQTALLAEIAKDVFTIERVAELADSAEKHLRSLGYKNIHYRIGDGQRGWPEKAPFDGIIVAAAAEKVPQGLKGQLAVGGRMLIPVGKPSGAQKLLRIERTENNFVSRELLDVRFVPLV